MGRLALMFVFTLEVAASYSPAPLEPDRRIAELSEDEWQMLCQGANSRRPRPPRGLQES